ncbi:MAG: hypothetical protein M0C28_07010 [Candidatus Moduliflexus flocculans]|nr:hypothetical protein [Candidatus Moduliflexus flocculans]
MKVSVEGPTEFAGNVFATISQRRGTHRQLGRGRPASRGSTPRCRWPRCSATRPSCAR